MVVIPCHSTNKQALHQYCSHDGRTCRSRRSSGGSRRSSDARRLSSHSIRTLGTSSLASSKEPNFFSSLYARFCQWVSNARSEGSISGISRTPSSGRRTPRSACRSRSSSMSSNKSQADLLQQLLAQMPPEYHEHASLHHSLSSEDSEFSSLHHRASYSSTCSSLTITSNSTATSDCHIHWGENMNAPNMYSSDTFNPYGLLQTNSAKDTTATNNRNRNFPSAWDRKSSRHTNLTFTISCPLKTKHPSVSIHQESPIQDSRTSLCATWPPLSAGRKFYGKILNNLSNCRVPSALGCYCAQCDSFNQIK